MSSRRKGREAAVQMLYQMDVSGVDAATAVANHWATLASNDEGREFADELVLGLSQQSERIDTLIRDTSKHWRLERMAKVDRNVIRLAVYELLERPDIPRKVTINEAVELAKRFGDENSSAFVNGVLDRIAETLQKQ